MPVSFLPAYLLTTLIKRSPIIEKMTVTEDNKIICIDDILDSSITNKVSTSRNSLKICNARKAVMMPATTPPNTPSQVLAGLTLLASACFPYFFPEK